MAPGFLRVGTAKLPWVQAEDPQIFPHYRLRARELLAELEHSMGADEVEASRNRARELDVAELVDEVLGELNRICETLAL